MRWIVAQIDHHRMKTPVEPAIEGVQVPPARPRRRYTVPTVELLLENLAAHLFQTLAGLFLVLTFRKQVDRRVVPMQPTREWLVRHHHNCCSVEGSHACQRLRRFTSGGLPMVEVQHPTQSLATPDGSGISSMGFIRNEAIAISLAASLATIMRHEFVDRLS